MRALLVDGREQGLALTYPVVVYRLADDLGDLEKLTKIRATINEWLSCCPYDTFGLIGLLDCFGVKSGMWCFVFGFSDAVTAAVFRSTFPVTEEAPMREALEPPP